jgi:segregation and condensation protein A
MDYQLTLEHYQGPLDKLLELIEERKLEVSRVSLAEVTADFVKYLEKLEEHRASSVIIADFLVIASRLVLIKSKELLPLLAFDEEEEEEIRSFEWGLKVYQELKKTHRFIREKWSEMPQMASREFMAGTTVFFFPPRDLKPSDLKAAMEKLTQTLESFFKPTATIKNKIVELKTKIEEILNKIAKQPTNLRELSKNKPKGEIVVLFLAILHLIKDQLIQAEQHSHFSDIKVAKK